MKNIILLVLVASGFWWWQYRAMNEPKNSQAQEQIVDSLKSIRHSFSEHSTTNDPVSGAISVKQAQSKNLNKVQVYGEGKVIKILPDDNKGSRHQRFILNTDNGTTLLVVHNIDLAPRLGGLQRGDKIVFSGEYISNDRGGLIHWTHHDPSHRHADGWLLYQGRRYQ